MTKKEILQHLSSATDQSQTVCEDVLNEFVDLLKQKVAAGEDLAYPGFGKFTITHREPRQGRNPQTGDPVHIPASNSVRFKPASTIKEAANTPITA